MTDSPHITLGIAAQQRGHWKEALRHYDAAIEADPSEAVPFQLRGALLLDLARYQEALRDFDQSILLAPFNEIGYWGKAKVFVGLKDYRWAVIQFTNAIDLVPEDAEQLGDLYRDRAEAYQLLGMVGLAAADREQAGA